MSDWQNPIHQHIQRNYPTDSYLQSEVWNLDGNYHRAHERAEALYSYQEQRGLWLSLFRACLGQDSSTVSKAAANADTAFVLVHARWPKLNPDTPRVNSTVNSGSPDPQEANP